MSCNCKVNKQITFLQKKYGHNIPVSKESKIRFKITQFFTHFWVYLIMILCLPLMIFHVLFVLLFKKDKKIKIRNIFYKNKILGYAGK